MPKFLEELDFIVANAPAWGLIEISKPLFIAILFTMELRKFDSSYRDSDNNLILYMKDEKYFMLGSHKRYICNFLKNS